MLSAHHPSQHIHTHTHRVGSGLTDNTTLPLIKRHPNRLDTPISRFERVLINMHISVGLEMPLERGRLPDAWVSDEEDDFGLVGGWWGEGGVGGEELGWCCERKRV